MRQQYKRKTILMLIGLYLMLLITRVVALDQFAVTDETAWVYRSANFYYALGQRDFAATYQNGTPGVPVMWIGASLFC